MRTASWSLVNRVFRLGLRKWAPIFTSTFSKNLSTFFLLPLVNIVIRSSNCLRSLVSCL